MTPACSTVMRTLPGAFWRGPSPGLRQAGAAADPRRVALNRGHRAIGLGDARQDARVVLLVGREGPEVAVVHRRRHRHGGLVVAADAALGVVDVTHMREGVVVPAERLA